MANLVALENATVVYGTTAVLDAVSTGVGTGQRIGVVGRNGGGKSTLLRVLAGDQAADGGRVTRAGGTTVGLLSQDDTLDPAWTVREAVVGDLPGRVRRRGHPRPVVPRRGRHADVGGDRRDGPVLRGRVCGIRPGPRRARPAFGGRRGAPREPAPQGAGLATAGAAGPHQQAPVPDRRGQRPHRERAAAARRRGPGPVRDPAAGQGRRRPRRRVGAAGRPAHPRRRDLAARTW